MPIPYTLYGPMIDWLVDWSIKHAKITGEKMEQILGKAAA